MENRAVVSHNQLRNPQKSSYQTKPYKWTHLCGQKMSDWGFNLSISLTFELLFVGISIS